MWPLCLRKQPCPICLPVLPVCAPGEWEVFWICKIIRMIYFCSQRLHKGSSAPLIGSSMYSFVIIAQSSFKQPRKVAESGQYDCTEVLIAWLSLRDDSTHFPNLLPCSRSLSDPPETQGGLIWTAHALMVLSIHLSCKWARMLKHSSQASVK